MALETPTTKEINDIIIAQLQASLNQTIPLLPRSFLRVLAKVIAAVFTLLYKYGGFMFLQIFVKTATINETTINGVVISPLIEWGRLKGVGDPVAATQAELLIDITVENQVGTLPSGSQLVGPNNGVTYITLGDVLLNAPTVQATIRAVSDQAGGGGAGAIGNLDPGSTVTFANPLADINREAIVNTQVVTGANGESEEAYRQRVIDRFQKLPQGGAYADYEIWGEEVAGIINVYPYTSDCPGQVDVYAEATPESSGSADGIPTDAQLQAVLDSIFLDLNGLNSRRPANALVNAFPINRRGFQTTVRGLVVDNSVQVQSDITDGVTEYMRDREPFIIGLSIPPRRDRVTESAVGGLVEDIVSAAGGIFSTATVTAEAEFIPASTFVADESVAAQETTPTSFEWSPNGLKFFIVGAGAEVFEYDVSAAFDLSSSVSYSGNSFDVSTQEATPQALRFNTDGTKFFIVGDTADTVFEYTVSVGFDLSSTVVYSGQSFSIAAQETDAKGLDFSDDGKKFFIVGDGATVYEYTVSEGFALASTVAYTGKSFDVSAQAAAPVSIRFTDAGSIFYVIDTSTVYEYLLSVPFNLATDVDYTGNAFSFATEDTAPQDVDFNSDKTKLFSIGDQNDKVYEYATGVTTVPVDLFTLGIGEKAKSTGVAFQA